MWGVGSLGQSRILFRHRHLGHLYVLDFQGGTGRLVMANEVLETTSGKAAPSRLCFTPGQRRQIRRRRAGLIAACLAEMQQKG